VLGAGVSVVVPMAFALVGRRTPEAARSTAISRISVIGYSGFFFGPPLMGFLSEWSGLPVSFSAIGLVLVVMAFPVVALLARRA
jgi:cyanate permease